MLFFRRRKRDQFNRKPRRRLSETIPQRYQWAFALACVSLITAAGLSLEVVTAQHNAWGTVWRAFLAGAIVTAGAYGCYRICQR